MSGVGVTSSDGRSVAYSVDTETGAFSFDAGQFNDLAVGESATVTVAYDVVDGNRGSVANTAEITVDGVNDAPTATGGSGSVTEDGTLSAGGTIDVSDPDTSDDHSFSIPGGGAGTYGTMSVDANGNWTYNLSNGAANVQALDAGQSVVDSFVFNVDDGNSGVTTANVDVTVNGADDGTTHVMNFTGHSHWGMYEDGMYLDTVYNSHYHQHNNIHIHGGWVNGSNGASQWVSGYGTRYFGSNFEDLDWVEFQAYSWMTFDNLEFIV